MRISRVWAMPNKRTFQIKPIAQLISKYKNNGIWIDPFSFPFKKDAIEYMNEFKEDSIDGILFDPPYSPRQLKECYDSLGQSLTSLDTSNHTWKIWKDKVAEIIKPGGIAICFGWNSGGLGKNRGFKFIEILLVCHGGNHNDTIVTVENKLRSPRKNEI